MRSLRFAAVTIFGICLLVAPASAATAPTVSLNVSTSTPVDNVLVSVAGRARPVPRGSAAVLQRDVGTGWERVRSVTVGTNGVFRTSYRPVVGRNRIRLVLPATDDSARGVSNTANLTVVPMVTPVKPVAGDTVTVSGHLPIALVRSVRLQLEGTTGWRTAATARTSSDGVFALKARLNASARLRVEAPEVRTKHTLWPRFVTPVRSVVLDGTPAAGPMPADSLSPSVAESIETTPIEPEWTEDATQPTVEPTSEPSTEPSAEPTVEPTASGSPEQPDADVAPGTLMPAEPRVVGRLEVGATVTAATEAWGPGEVQLAYQWRRDGQVVAGAADPTYVLADADAETHVSVAVTGSREGYVSETRESAASEVVRQPSCNAEPPTKVDGTRWQCTFADEFDGDSLDRTKWMPQRTSVSGIKSGPGCIVDDVDNVSVGGGTLHLTAQREASPFTCSSPNGDSTTEYTNGSVTSFGRFSQAFGRYEIRAKFPDARVPGLQGALWLYPVVQRYGSWPRSGEIDIAEVYSRYPDRAIPFVHYRTADPNDPTVTNTACKLNPAEFHTYVLEWTTSTITISYDGVLCMKHTIAPAWPMPAPLPFGRPFAVILTQVQGRDGTNQFDPETTPLPATTQVDYVRVWK